MSEHYSEQHGELSLESVILAFANWRSVKNAHGVSNKPIPSELWDMVFALEAKGLPARAIKSALGLSSGQYKSQKAKREQSKSEQQRDEADTSTVATFAEAIVSPSQAEHGAEVPSLSDLANETRQQVRQLKITDNSKHQLSSETVIVECFHSDGHRLKIHATSEKMSEIFSAFFQQPIMNNSPC
jgi:hypothetical protein